MEFQFDFDRVRTTMDMIYSTKVFYAKIKQLNYDTKQGNAFNVRYHFVERCGKENFDAMMLEHIASCNCPLMAPLLADIILNHYSGVEQREFFMKLLLKRCYIPLKKEYFDILQKDAPQVKTQMIFPEEHSSSIRKSMLENYIYNGDATSFCLLLDISREQIDAVLAEVHGNYDKFLFYLFSVCSVIGFYAGAEYAYDRMSVDRQLLCQQYLFTYIFEYPIPGCESMIAFFLRDHIFFNSFIVTHDSRNALVTKAIEHLIAQRDVEGIKQFRAAYNTNGDVMPSDVDLLQIFLNYVERVGSARRETVVAQDYHELILYFSFFKHWNDLHPTWYSYDDKSYFVILNLIFYQHFDEISFFLLSNSDYRRIFVQLYMKHLLKDVPSVPLTSFLKKTFPCSNSENPIQSWVKRGGFSIISSLIEWKTFLFTHSAECITTFLSYLTKTERVRIISSFVHRIKTNNTTDVFFFRDVPADVVRLIVSNLDKDGQKYVLSHYNELIEPVAFMEIFANTKMKWAKPRCFLTVSNRQVTVSCMLIYLLRAPYYIAVPNHFELVIQFDAAWGGVLSAGIPMLDSGVLSTIFWESVLVKMLDMRFLDFVYQRLTDEQKGWLNAGNSISAYIHKKHPCRIQIIHWFIKNITNRIINITHPDKLFHSLYKHVHTLENFWCFDELMQNAYVYYTVMICNDQNSTSITSAKDAYRNHVIRQVKKHPEQAETRLAQLYLMIYEYIKMGEVNVPTLNRIRWIVNQPAVAAILTKKLIANIGVNSLVPHFHHNYFHQFPDFLPPLYSSIAPITLLHSSVKAACWPIYNLLLSITAVRQEAIENNFYNTRIRSYAAVEEAVNIGRESSMARLTPAEKATADYMSTVYDPIVKSLGVEAIIATFCDQMKKEYQKSPIRDGTLVLPFEWDAFKSAVADFDRVKQKHLKKLYLSHPFHTAARYFMRPNRWMSPRAASIIETADGRRWADNDNTDIRHLFALYYVAATDATTPSIDGCSINDRFLFFVQTVAHISRAHNYDREDRTRIRKLPNGESVTEVVEYDDGDGDRPSCLSGVRRRLMTSAPSNPHSRFVDVEQKATDILRSMLLKKIPTVGSEERTALDAAFEKYIINLMVDGEDQFLLMTYNLMVDEEQTCLELLRKEMGERVTPAVEARVHALFQTNDDTCHCHIIQYIPHYPTLLS